jgi:hypothetical protein
VLAARWTAWVATRALAWPRLASAVTRKMETRFPEEENRRAKWGKPLWFRRAVF